MKQSTTDVVNAVNDLIANAAAVDKALEALVEAQSNEDDTALEAAVTQLVDLKKDQDDHLTKLTAAVPPVVAAPADPAPVEITPPVDNAG
jgi:hypothetical protein